MNAEKFLKAEISYPTRQKLVSAVTRACNDTMKLKDIDQSFDCQKGEETLKIVRNLKIETQIRDESQKGLLPFEAIEKRNCANNCTHYEFNTNGAIITISAVDMIGGLPRKAKYRENLSLNNQISLFDFENDFESDFEDKKHILLTHYEENGILKGAFLGVPSADGKTWKYNLNLLEELKVIDDVEEKLPNNLLKIRKNIIKEANNNE